MLLDISYCIINKCKTLQLIDNTGIYDLNSNPSGWQQSDIDNLTSASVQVIFNDSIIYTIDVLNNIPSSPQDSYTLLTYTADSFLDGNYVINIVLTDNLGVDTITTLGFFSTCNVRCCVDGLWSKAAKDEDSCGCNGSGSYTMLALQAEGLLGLIRNAASCINVDSRDAILKKLQRICKFEKCNCN